MEEITGSGIFSCNREDDASELSSASSTENGPCITPISLGGEESVSPKWPTDNSARDTEADAAELKKQLSDAKYIEIRRTVIIKGDVSPSSLTRKSI